MIKFYFFLIDVAKKEKGRWVYKLMLSNHMIERQAQWRNGSASLSGRRACFTLGRSAEVEDSSPSWVVVFLFTFFFNDI